MAGGAHSLLLGHAAHQTGWVVVYNSLALIAHHIIDLTIRHGRLKGTYGFGQWPSNAAHHVVILYPQWLLAKQAEAYLAVISRSTEEDKNQPWALFSLQPSRVTGLLYSAWNLWDDHLWWPGCPPFAVMFSMVMMLPLCLGPQNRHPPCDSISLLKVIVDGSIKRGKNIFFSLHSTSHPLRSFIFARQASLFMSSSSARGCIRFELVALMGMGVIWNDLDTTSAHQECNVAVGSYRESKAVAWNSAHWVLVITAAWFQSHKSHIRQGSKAVSSVLHKTVMLCIRCVVLQQLYIMHIQMDLFKVDYEQQSSITTLKVKENPSWLKPNISSKKISWTYGGINLLATLQLYLILPLALTPTSAPYNWGIWSFLSAKKPVCGLLWGEAGQIKPLDSGVDLDHLPKSRVGFGRKGFSQVLL